MGKGLGAGTGSGKGLDSKITALRYILLAFTAITWLLGVVVFALSIWLNADSAFNEWVTRLDLQNFYIGVYILLFGACIVMISSFFACVFLLQENASGLTCMVGTQIIKFICGLVGAAVLLNFSTRNSDLQPMIKKSMYYLIAESQWEEHAVMLRMIQENIGCCGADGPNDYLTWRKPLPPECRDTVTGNAFFHGCVDELTWFIEEKASWLSGVVMVLCFFTILKAVLSTLLVKAIKANNP